MTDVIGIIGAFLVLVAFLQNQRGKWTTDSTVFDLVNAIGSIFLLTYAVILGSIPFMLTNTVWLLVSLKDVVKAFMKRP